MDKENSLAAKFPELAAEWHPTRNGDLTPEMVTFGSNKKVWWLGKCGHEWQAMVAHRSSGFGCPYCTGRKILTGYNDFSTIHPELAAQWHPTRNGDLTPEMVTSGSVKKVWWSCSSGHEWESTVYNRSRGKGCPVCAGKKVSPGHNDLAATNPELAAQWHPTKNVELTPQMIAPGSNKKAWWICSEGHEWQARVADRSAGSGCPVCAVEKRKNKRD